MEERFKPGQLVIYKNGDRLEVGKIKRINGDGAWVWYHSGETAALTNFRNLYPLENAYCIKETSLGGDVGKEIT